MADKEWCDEPNCYRTKGHPGGHETLAWCRQIWPKDTSDHSSGYGPGADEVEPAPVVPSVLPSPVAGNAHYQNGRIQVWDFILDQKLGYLPGNVIKYVCRASHKGSYREDLVKARHYIDKMIEVFDAQDPF